MQTTFMTKLFGPKCPLVTFLKESACALTLLSQEYTGSDWMGDISNEYIHKCNKANTKFFDYQTQASNFTGYSPLEEFMDYFKTVKSGWLHPNSTLPPFLQRCKLLPLMAEFTCTQAYSRVSQKRRHNNTYQNNSVAPAKRIKDTQSFSNACNPQPLILS